MQPSLEHYVQQWSLCPWSMYTGKEGVASGDEDGVLIWKMEKSESSLGKGDEAGIGWEKTFKVHSIIR